MQTKIIKLIDSACPRVIGQTKNGQTPRGATFSRSLVTVIMIIVLYVIMDFFSVLRLR